MTDTNPHTPAFDPTVDELETLKQLEVDTQVMVPEALKAHLSTRLYEQGYIAVNAEGRLVITEQGRQLIRRQEG